MSLLMGIPPHALGETKGRYPGIVSMCPCHANLLCTVPILTNDPRRKSNCYAGDGRDPTASLWPESFAAELVRHVGHSLREELTRLAKTRLAENSLTYLNCGMRLLEHAACHE